MRPWVSAWQDALYGPWGFYRRPEGPAGHFTTSTHGGLGAVFAEAIAALVDREGLTRVVDFACGRELLRHLAALRPDLEFTGVDIVDRPPGLPEAIAWVRSPGGATFPSEVSGLRDTLLLAHEWLDVVPCPVAQVDARGVPREVHVDEVTGEESLGPPLSGPERKWVERWWPDAAAGERIEVGLTRDHAYADLCAAVASGAVLAVDYGHVAGDRPSGGTLTAFRAGEQTTPVPDGSCDLTAHVALDSLGADEVLTQREALAQLGFRGERPPHAMASTDPAGYLHALARASTVAALRDPGGLGAFGWALTRR